MQIVRHPFYRKRTEVLQDVSLSVPTGSTTGLLGPNGAGKTTLLRILATTVLPDRGKATILGHDTAESSSGVRRQVGFVLGEERSFFWRLTAEQNLKFFATMSDIEPCLVPERIAVLSELLEVKDELAKPFRNLSTGMRQRLGIARALLHDPAVLLIDEPTRGLDPGAAQRLRRFIQKTLIRQMGKTLLLATHNVAEARELCDRVAFLKAGRILIQGEAEPTLQRIGEVFEAES